MLLKTSGETRGNHGKSWTGYVMYHQERKIEENKNFIGDNITKGAAEYISIILGLIAVRRKFRCTRNKIIIIHIKS